jgi:hypothetical protein
MMFVQSWTKEEFALYPENTYEKGGSVNINGKYRKSAEADKRYNEYGPLKKSGSSSWCDGSCKRQDECNPIRGNICDSTFDANSKTCFCSFRKKSVLELESFEGMNNTALNLMALARVLPNEAKPCWVYQKTQNVYMPLDQIRQGEMHPLLSELNIPDNNRMSMSFWIYLDENSSDDELMYLLMNNVRGIRFFIKGKTLVIKRRNISFDKIIPVGTTVDSSWITITYNEGTQNIYLNGKLTDSSLASSPFQPLDKKGALYFNNPKGVFIKDLKFYDHTLSEKGISILYKGV